MVDRFHAGVACPNRLLVVGEHDVVQIKIQLQIVILVNFAARLGPERLCLLFVFRSFICKSVLTTWLESIIANSAASTV